MSADCVSGDKGQTSVKKNAELLKTGSLINNIYNTEGNAHNCKITPTDFCSPFLVATEDVMIALAGVKSNGGSEEKINILTKYIKTTNIGEWIATNNMNEDDNKLRKQFAAKEVVQNKKDGLKFLLSAAKNKTIYILLVNESAQDTSNVPGNKLKWDCSFFVGTFTDGATNEAEIKWNDKTLPGTDNVGKFKKQFEDESLNSFPSDGFVLLTEEGNLFFVLQFDVKNNKKTFALIQFEEAGVTVKISEPAGADGCTFKLFTRKEKIMLAEYCPGDKNSIHELQLSDETTWKEVDEPISRLLPYLREGNNFTAAKINDVSVLFFTKEKEITEGSDANKFCVDLWMSDGTRVALA